jgi:predicted glycosyltransferase
MTLRTEHPQSALSNANRTARGRGPSIVLYSHDGFGLGHLSRTIRIGQSIRTLQPRASILIITSSPAARCLALPEDFECIKLPSVTKTGVERYRPHLDASLEAVVALRSALLLSTVQHLRPDVLLVDHRPLGLKKEVLPTLEWIRESAPEIRTVAGLRDIIDEADTVVRDRTVQNVYDALEHLYDCVLVYGDRSILDSTREYAFPRSIVGKTYFTGYLGRAAAGRSREEVHKALRLDGRRLVVVHAGGGGDGTALIDTYLQCIDRLPDDVHSLVVTGPLMERGERKRLQAGATTLPVTLVEYQEDLASCIAAADLSVSMGGYNTICEILSARVRALVVPRIFPRQEQYIRAQRLAARGMITMLLPIALTPQTLADAVHAALQSCPAPSDSISLDGGRRAAEVISSHLSSHPAATRRVVHA